MLQRFLFLSVSSDQVWPSVYSNRDIPSAKSGRMKRIGIGISAWYNVVAISLRFSYDFPILFPSHHVWCWICSLTSSMSIWHMASSSARVAAWMVKCRFFEFPFPTCKAVMLVSKWNEKTSEFNSSGQTEILKFLQSSGGGIVFHSYMFASGLILLSRAATLLWKAASFR